MRGFKVGNAAVSNIVNTLLLKKIFLFCLIAAVRD